MQGTTVREVKPEDIGWLAGIIDGEASITCNKTHSIPPKIVYSIHIVGGDLSLLNKAIRIVNQFDDGQGISAKLYKKNYKSSLLKSNKQMYHLQIWRQGVLLNLLRVILPHLTEKYLQGARLLNFLENHKKGFHFKEGEIDAFLSFTPAETK